MVRRTFRCRGTGDEPFLWGDVPAVMPITLRGVKVGGLDWKHPSDPRHRPGQAFNPAAQGAATRDERAIKNTGGSWFNIAHNTTSGKGQNPDGRKLKDQDGYERSHPNAFGWKAPRTSSRQTARKAASAMIAKIPLPLARHIARTFYPR
jgi:hypothetical protein